MEDRGLYALNLRQQFFTLAEKGVYAIGAHAGKCGPGLRQIQLADLVQLLPKSGPPQFRGIQSRLQTISPNTLNAQARKQTGD